MCTWIAHPVVCTAWTPRDSTITRSSPAERLAHWWPSTRNFLVVYLLPAPDVSRLHPCEIRRCTPGLPLQCRGKQTVSKGYQRETLTHPSPRAPPSRDRSLRPR